MRDETTSCGGPGPPEHQNKKKRHYSFINLNLFHLFFFFFYPPAHFESLQLTVAFLKRNALNDLATTIKAFKKIFPSVFLHSLFFLQSLDRRRSRLFLPFFPGVLNRTFSHIARNRARTSSPSRAEILDCVSPTSSRERLFATMQTTHEGKEKSPVNSLISNYQDHIISS